MRLAVFTNAFPGHVNTFFARDMRCLLDAGIELDVFPMHPLSPENWRLVPSVLGQEVFPRERVHHVRLPRDWRYARPRSWRGAARALGDGLAATTSAARYGVVPAAKTAYSAFEACIWAARQAAYDHVLAYWGNYAATSAYMFDRLLPSGRVPFSMLLHSAVDLYSFRGFLRQKLAYADNIIVISEYNRSVLRSAYPDLFPALSKKVHLHYIGLDLTEFAFHEGGRSTRRVLGVGGLDKVKGFDDLVRAVGKLRAKGRSVELEIIGDGPEGRALRRLVCQLGLESQTTFRGWLDDASTRMAIRQATILALPSRGDAFPTVLKEAMALGTPVVATAVNGIPELLDGGECGALVPPRNFSALGDAMERLLDDPALRRRYAQAARKYVEKNFDLRTNGRRLAELLRCTTTCSR